MNERMSLVTEKVLELPIPQFDANNSAHRELSEFGKSCAQKVSRWLSDGNAGTIKSVGRLRGMVRAMLKEELSEIDVLVKGILR